MPAKPSPHVHEQSAHPFGYALQPGDYREPWRIFRIMSEFVEGYEFLSELKNEITILGSARFKETSKYYEVARELGGKLAQKGFSVITGGGPGIMQAANQGAFEAKALNEAKGQSIGLNIQLPFEQVLNPFVTKATSFYYFFTRKVMLTSPANAFVYFPGGFGTMDEFFEVVDLIDLGFILPTPIVLVGKEFWNPLLDFLKKNSHHAEADQAWVDSWHVVDTADEAMKILSGITDRSDICALDPMSFHCSGNIDWKIFRIMAELVEGFEFVSNISQTVTVLGTKDIPSTSTYYQSARNLGAHLVQAGYSVMTGANKGVAEAANQGAFEHGGVSMGIAMQVRGKAFLNHYLTKSIQFNFPFTRKLILTTPTSAFVFYPGGFGTLHQLFEVLTLIQTKKMARVPVILVDHSFWSPLHSFIKGILVHDVDTINDEDDELYQIVDNEESVLKVLADTAKTNVRAGAQETNN